VLEERMQAPEKYSVRPSPLMSTAAAICWSISASRTRRP
jgi:hypothetical protein